VRLQLQRDGCKLKVFEFLAPLVDTPFSAGVTSDQKMPAQTAVDELMAGLERDELELLVGGSRQAYEALRESPDAAVQAINAAIGG